MGEDENLTISTLTGHRSMMESLIKQYKGRVVDSPGGNMLAEFASVLQAVNCAVEIQRDWQNEMQNFLKIGGWHIGSG